jgi:hypothetical protein
MNVKNYISAIIYSLYSRAFYANLFSENRLSPIKYLILLCIIIAIPNGMQIKSYMNNFAIENENIQNLEYIKKQIPNIIIEGENIKFDTPTNINVISKEGNLVAIFDVENKVDDISKFEKILVFKNNVLIIKLPEKQNEIAIDLKSLKDSFKQYQTSTDGKKKIDVDKFLTDFTQILNISVISITFMLSLWYFLSYLISILGYSLLAGLLYNLMLKTKGFNFKQSFKIATFTATPIFLLEMLAGILGYPLFSRVSLVYFITHLIYIHFAIESYKKLERFIK